MENHVSNLVGKVLAGDLDAYREIVRIFESDVYGIAAPMIGDRTAAEDITQETFLVAYERLDSFDAKQPMRPWLLGIARNLVRNEMRRRYREDSRLELYSRFVNQPLPKTEVAFTGEIATALSDCRGRLGETADAAIEARYDDGLDLEAVANRLQRSVSATRQLLYRARLALRDCIESRLAAIGAES